VVKSLDGNTGEIHMGRHPAGAAINLQNVYVMSKLSRAKGRR
jgi:hypothetical protein